MRRSILYFALAALPALLQAKDQPVTQWAWFLFVGQALYQGLLALKALQSAPDESPRPVTVQQPKDHPIPVEETKT